MSKELRRKKRQLKKDIKATNYFWKLNAKLDVFFNDKMMGKLRLPSGLFVDKDERHPVPTRYGKVADPAVSNHKRVVGQRIMSGRLGNGK